MNKSNRNNINEAGQIIYLVAIGIVLLFGFLGLAVDGGRLYSENRRAQHAADNAAMTGALYIGQNYQTLEDQQASGVAAVCNAGILCISNKTGKIALESAGFHISDYLVDYNIVAHPSPYSGIEYVDIEVVLEVEIDPYFAKVFTDQPLRTKVVSVARVYPSQNFAFGYSMISTKRDICEGIKISGSVDILLAAGGVHSNSSDPDCDAIWIKGGHNTSVTINGPFTGSSTLGLDGNPDLIPTLPYEIIPPVTLPAITPPECNDPVPVSSIEDAVTGKLTFYPGNHSSIEIERPGDIIFEPGIYCVHGGMKILGGTFYGDGVLFYIVDGDVDFSANAEIHITAPTGGVSDIHGRTIYDGLVIYSNPETLGTVVIQGNADSEFSGTVFAPGEPPLPQPKCKFIGDGVGVSINYGIQMICSTIEVNGNATLNFSFSDELLYSPPPLLNLLH